MKALLLPPGSLIGLLLVAAVLLPRRARAGQRVLWLALALLYLLSTPLVAVPLLRSLHWYPPLAALPAEAPGAILVLAAGRERDWPGPGEDGPDLLGLERLRAAAHLHRRTGLPVLASGGVEPTAPTRPSLAAAMAATLVRDFVVAAPWVEERSRDTAGNARESAAMLAARGIRRVYLVTHAWHLPRALAEARAAGLDAVPVPASAPPAWPEGGAALWPSARALQQSAWAVHEWLGLAWQRLRTASR